MVLNHYHDVVYHHDGHRDHRCVYELGYRAAVGCLDHLSSRSV